MFQKCINTEKDRAFWGGAMLNAKWVREHAFYSSEGAGFFFENAVEKSGAYPKGHAVAGYVTDFSTALSEKKTSNMKSYFFTDP